MSSILITPGVTLKLAERGDSSSYDAELSIVRIDQATLGDAGKLLSELAHEMGHFVFRDYKMSELKDAIARQDTPQIAAMLLQREAMAVAFEYTSGISRETGYVEISKVRQIYLNSAAQVANQQNKSYMDFMQAMAKRIVDEIKRDSKLSERIMQRAEALRDGKRVADSDWPPSDGVKEITVSVDGEPSSHWSYTPEYYEVPDSIPVFDGSPRHIEIWRNGEKITDEVMIVPEGSARMGFIGMVIEVELFESKWGSSNPGGPKVPDNPEAWRFYGPSPGLDASEPLFASPDTSMDTVIDRSAALMIQNMARFGGDAIESTLVGRRQESLGVGSRMDYLGVEATHSV